ncbi:DUF1499 domain-containing protein [Emcibacter nanhaiensis]|uniref:DUF1499 domain-containing protein n=1 Tax=Emcibacter nanhaiensis TaxID=1505037 RepID=A0A501PG38_9PROT|nr:DUF1499 domain-containing protein [Emcibacter nanhaiensis]TPD58962.1 DUF1499 domain-containing protein [Emcibacter nanhaiensis]
MIIGKRKKSLLARLFFYMAVLLLLSLACLGGAVRLDLISPVESFTLTSRLAFYGGSLLMFLSLLALISVSRNHRLKGTAQLLLTLVIGLALSAPVLYLQKTNGGVPKIHDITTDTEHPPTFTVLQEDRRTTDNSLDYAGEQLAARQQAAYPQIRPLITPLPQDAAFDTAIATARELGWQIVLADRKSGRIEATDRTTWFRFIDDIAIIVSPRDNGSRIDLRSSSRTRDNDLGTNARRITAFIRLFDGKTTAR